MDDQKKALMELLEKVEASQILMSRGGTGQFKALGFSQMSRAASAYHGSLDAAKALNDAVLPGWYVFIKGEKGYAWIVQLDHDDFGRTDQIEAETPARAWLIAILKALIAELDA